MSLMNYSLTSIKVVLERGGVYFPLDLQFYGYYYDATDCYKIDEITKYILI